MDPVHYVAHGKFGMMFDCYRRALSAEPRWPNPIPRGQKAQRSTSIDKVTCLACMDSLREFLNARNPEGR